MSRRLVTMLFTASTAIVLGAPGAILATVEFL